MKADVLHYCRQQGFFSSGDRVICALSGGADSLAMLHCLHSLRDVLEIQVEAAHFNHKLRGEESDADQQFVECFCKERQIPLSLGQKDVAAYAKEKHLSLEEAARQCRYDFFASLHGKIATAHTADDHLETVLMHLLRGSGLRGLCGIPPTRENYVRPLLCVTRQQVLEYLQAEGLSHREDSSNKDLRFTRNRLRHKVLPLLRQENPRLASRILKQSSLLRAEDQLLDQMAGQLLEQDEAGAYAIAPLLSAPDPLQKRALRLILGQELPQDAALAHIEALQQLLANPCPSASAHLPGGLLAKRSYDRLLLCRHSPSSFTEAELPLVPGTRLSFGDFSILSEVHENFIKMTNTPFHFAIKYDMILQPEIHLRPRRIGDRLQMPDGHSKSLKKLMIERKIPQDQRDVLPVFVHGDQILAVAGLGADGRSLPKEGEAALIIEIKKAKEDPL